LDATALADFGARTVGEERRLSDGRQPHRESDNYMFVERLPSIDPLPELPVGHPLASAWAKFARGCEHFEELCAAAREIVAATLASGALEARRVGSGLVSVRACLPAIPLRTSCILGDVVHELRTALDNVAWALAQRAGFAGNPRKIQFPISLDASDFAGRRATLTEIFGAAVDVLEQVQPYHDRPGLRWLQHLNNVDKHEAVVLARHHLQITGVELEDRVGRRRMDESGGPNVPLIVTDGEEVFRCQHEGERLTGIEFHVGFVSSLGLRAAAGRSWPEERLDLIVRQIFVDVEETLLTIRALFDDKT
jgi:hypothetical protein